MFTKIIRPVLVGSLGFAITFACCIAVAGRPGPPSPAADRPAVDQPVTSTPQLSPLEETVAKLQALPTTAPELLSAAAQSSRLDRADRLAALGEALQLPEETRRPLLSILLSQWAETHPAEAAEWCIGNLEGADRDAAFRDVGNTWAQDNPFAFARWAAASVPAGGRRQPGHSHVMQILNNHDPLAFSTFMALPELHGIVASGHNFDPHLTDPDALPRLAIAIAGNVAYRTDQPEHLILESSSRHQPGKSGWNSLFEQTAVAWHRHDPDACEEWLAGFPEPAQTAARHRINPRQ